MFSCIMKGIIAIFGPESQKSTLSVKVSGFCLSSLPTVIRKSYYRIGGKDKDASGSDQWCFQPINTGI